MTADRSDAPRRLRLTLIALVSALGLISVGALLVARQINSNARDLYIGDVIPLRTAVQGLVQAMVDQETAVRGYLIRPDTAFLEPYREGRKQAAERLADIDEHTDIDPILADLLRQARPQIDGLENYFAGQIVQVQEGRQAAAQANVDGGKARFDDFRRTARLMQEETDAFTRESQRAQDRRANISMLTIAVLGGGALLLGALLAILVPRRAAALLAALRRGRETVARAQERTARLQELTARLSAAATTDEVATAVLEPGRHATGAAAGSIALLGEGGREFITRGLVGYPTEIAEAFPRYPVDAALPIPDAVRQGPLWLPSAAAVVERYPHLADFHRGLSHEAVASLPLGIDGRTFGGLTLSFAEVQGFSAGQRVFLETVADLCAQALERSRLYGLQQEIAATLQRSLLPQTLPVVSGVDVVARYRAAAETQFVGGDFYDAFELEPGRMAVVVGDVCGKGPAAAALTALARHTIRAVAGGDRTPSDVLGLLNDTMLRQDRDGPFLTAIYVQMAILDGGIEIDASRAGHPFGLIVRTNGHVERLGADRGQLLGVVPHPTLHDVSARLAPGDTLLLFTDGLSEARRGGVLLGNTRLEEIVRRCARLSSEESADHLFDAIVEFAQGSLRDDAALLLVRCRHSEPEPEERLVETAPPTRSSSTNTTPHARPHVSAPHQSSRTIPTCSARSATRAWSSRWASSITR